MNYPNLKLTFTTDFTPQIIFSPEEGMEREMLKNEDSIGNVLKNLAEELEIADDVEHEEEEKYFINLFQLTEMGDETLGSDFPRFEGKDESLKLEERAETYRKQIEEEQSEAISQYGELESAVEEELTRNLHLDIFASVADYLNYVLTAKLVLMATDLGIGKLYLEDPIGNIRLRARMSSELKEVGVELEIV